MKYKDFTIDLSSAGPGQFEAKVVDSQFRDTSPISFPAPIAPKILSALEKSFDGSGNAAEELPSDFELGQKLYGALFRNGLANLFLRSRERIAEDSGLRIRLRFRLDDPEVAYLGALPWEMLCGPSNEFLSTDRSTPIVREIQVAKVFKRLAVTPPLRILVVDSAANDYDKEKQRRSVELMMDALAPLETANQVKLFRLEEAKLDLLRNFLLREKIHVLHFMANAESLPRRGFDTLASEPSGALKLLGHVGSKTASVGASLVGLPKRRRLRVVKPVGLDESGRATAAGYPFKILMNYGMKPLWRR
jgi:hypothetical protein